MGIIMEQHKLSTPITFIFFNRLDTTLKVLECIRKAQPERLYLISDGARTERNGEKELVESIRNQVEAGIDWPCKIFKNYAEKNMGCHKRMASGITWVFEQEETSIILEDDIIPVPAFFQFCEELLIKYKNEDRVTYITGNNIYHDYPIKDSYLFSKFPSIWGWATWRRAWKFFDDSPAVWEKMKKANTIESYYGPKWAKFYKAQIEKAYMGELDTWDYQWEASRMYHNGLGIIPKYNMIENIGFNRDDATHTRGNSMYDFTKKNVEFPLMHPDSVQCDENYDRAYIKNIIAKEFERWTLNGKILRRLRMILSSK